jgi:hypothetical protein
MKKKTNSSKKTKKNVSLEEMLANTMTYEVYDMLCDIAEGGSFNFDEMEKSFLSSLLQVKNHVGK